MYKTIKPQNFSNREYFKNIDFNFQVPYGYQIRKNSMYIATSMKIENYECNVNTVWEPSGIKYDINDNTTEYLFGQDMGSMYYDSAYLILNNKMVDKITDFSMISYYTRLLHESYNDLYYKNTDNSIILNNVFNAVNPTYGNNLVSRYYGFKPAPLPIALYVKNSVNLPFINMHNNLPDGEYKLHIDVSRNYGSKMIVMIVNGNFSLSYNNLPINPTVGQNTALLFVDNIELHYILDKIETPMPKEMRYDFLHMEIFNKPLNTTSLTYSFDLQLPSNLFALMLSFRALNYDETTKNSYTQKENNANNSLKSFELIYNSQNLVFKKYYPLYDYSTDQGNNDCMRAYQEFLLNTSVLNGGKNNIVYGQWLSDPLYYFNLAGIDNNRVSKLSVNLEFFNIAERDVECLITTFQNKSFKTIRNISDNKLEIHTEEFNISNI